jgi:soluble lytic murein transglycosylase
VKTNLSRDIVMLHRFFSTLLIILSASAVMARGDGNPCDLGSRIRSFATSNDPKLLQSLIHDPLFVLDDEKYIVALIRLNASEKIKAYIEKTSVAALTSAARERRANALTQVINFDKEKITHHLYIDLAETQAARKIAPPMLTNTEWLRRIEVLSEHNDNQLVISEITQHPRKHFDCHVEFLLGKAFRKSRSYNEAMGVLDKVAQNCSGEDALNAGFVLARLAAISPSQENMKYFAAFQKKYPTHSYADDVLLFKASALETLGKKEEAKHTLREIWHLDTVADMRFEAIFRLAYMYALEGESAQAIHILQTSLQKNYEPAPTFVQIQRARYWIARLQLYPEVSSFKKQKRVQEAAARKALEELALSLHPTYYSWLAGELLSKETGVRVKRAAQSIQRTQERPISDANFKTIFCMMDQGFESEAKRLVELIEPGEVQVDQRLNIAHRLNDRGLFADAFRFAQSVVSEGPKSKNEDLRYLMYPKAYSAEVEDASVRVGPPQFLLYGLMREESRYDARAISWAGARGVLQLMPAVAHVEGRKFKRTDLTDEKMLDPKTNILLGAAHLKGMLDDVKHPLFAVAAYNAGLDRVKRWEERLKNYESLDGFIENIPLPETRDYVKRVASAWVNYAELYSSNDKPFSIEITSR